MTDVSIIIINYNTCKVTQNCIESIFKYTKDIDFEVILVDNNSQDDSFKEFSKDKRINYIYLSENLGFGKANNVGFSQAKGKYLFLLNSDTLLRSNAIREFYDYMENAPSNVACVGTILKDLNNNNIHSYGNFPNIASGIKWYSVWGILYFKLFNKIIQKVSYKTKVDYITGADLFIRKEVALKHGLFDPDFFMYFEETELQYRYAKLGYERHIYNKPHIVHLENYSMNNSYTKNLSKLGVSLISYYLYLKKCKGNFQYYFFRIIFGIICPLWIFYPKYSLKEELDFIKKAYRTF